MLSNVERWSNRIRIPGQSGMICPEFPSTARWWFRISASLAWIGVLLLGLPAAKAQPVPKITSISPDWVQRGTTSVVTLEGENLLQVDSFIFSGDGGLNATNAPAPVRAINLESSRGGISPADNDEKKLRISVVVAADASLGSRELRVGTPTGVSTPVTLNVSFLHELVESEPNNSTNQAQLIELPGAVSGMIGTAYSTEFELPDVESRRGFDILDEHFADSSESSEHAGVLSGSALQVGGT